MSPGVKLVTEVVDGYHAFLGMDERDDVSGDEKHIRWVCGHLQGKAKVRPEAREGHHFEFNAGRSQEFSIEFLGGMGVKI